MRSLSQRYVRAFKKGCPDCSLVDKEVKNLDDYLRVLDSVIGSPEPIWFRGHSDYRWRLVPTALRYKRISKRERALNLVAEFRRHSSHLTGGVIDEPQMLYWIQRAQHYGIPTRLLDWTEKAAIALYFACHRNDNHGAVCVLDPSTVNKLYHPNITGAISPGQCLGVVQPYLALDGKVDRKGLPTIAISPVWDNDRVRAQEGTFTLHGSKKFRLDSSQAPSLFVVPICKKYKRQMMKDLETMGVSEVKLFPELDKIASHLKIKANL